VNPPLILLVEDDPLDAELMLAALAETHPQTRVELVTTAESAWSAIDQLRSAGRLSTLALVLLDLKLPGMSGCDLLRCIRREPGIRRIPVVILTTSLEPRDIEECYDAGANSYLVKPATFAELLELAERVNRYWTGDNRRPPGNAA